MSKTVLVTGGSGFIGSWMIIELLKRGYFVRTTVRSPDKEAVVRSWITAKSELRERLSFAIVDLTNDKGWDKAVENCDYVIHVASPLDHGVKNPDELIVPARDGTLRVLRASSRAKVQRVVMTSALEACWPRSISPDRITDENYWTDIYEPGLSPYRLSKTIAEKTAWNFMSSLSGTMTLTTILPSAVLGPVFSKKNTGSVQLISRLLDGKMPAIPRIGFCVVDVRDVVDLHIRAMNSAEAEGERFIAAGNWMTWLDVADTLRSSLVKNAKKIPTRSMPDFVIKFAALFNRQSRFITPMLGRKHDFTAAKAEKVLGWNPRSVQSTIIDCAKSLIETKS